MGGDDRWTVVKLEGDSNWMTWKVQIKHLLLDRDLWGHVDGTARCANDATVKVKVEFKKMNQKALTAIVLSISPTLIPLVQLCQTPEEAWKALQEQFEKSTLMAKLHLRKKYFRLEMSEGTSAERHMREMREITDCLSAMGSSISEDDQVMTLLASLPSSYGSLVTTLGAQVSKLTWSLVQGIILDEETRRGVTAGKHETSALFGTVGGRPATRKPSQGFDKINFPVLLFTFVRPVASFVLTFTFVIPVCSNCK